MNQKLEPLHFSALPPEILRYIFQYLSPEYLCSALLLNSGFYAKYLNSVWDIKLKQHFPSFKTDAVYQSSYHKFVAAHQEGYKDQDKIARKSFSLVKEGDLAGLQQTLDLAFSPNYKIGALSFINTVISYAVEWKYQFILNFIYEKYLIDEPVIGQLADGSPYLLEPSKKYNKASTLEFALICQQSRERIVWLIDQGCDVNEKTDHNLYLLTRAAAQGHLEIVKLFIEKDAQVNAQDELGITALMAAVARRHWDIMEFLVAQGADTNPGGIGTPLMTAIINKDWDAMQFLVKHGANVNPSDIFNPLITVILKEVWEAMRFLVDHGAPINIPSEKGFTPLMIAIFFKHFDSVQFLVAKGANIDLVDKENRTALMHAEENDLWEIVKYLLEKDAKIDVESDYAKRLLVRAVARNSLQTVQILCQKGVDINAAALKLTPLVIAVLNGHWEIIRFLVAQGADIDLPDPSGITPLIAAVINNHLDIVKFLIQKNAKIDFANEKGRTALIFAEVEDHWDIVQLLLERGATVNPQSSFAKRLLVRATAVNSLAIIKILVQQGVDADTDILNFRPLQIALHQNHREIIKFLVENGASISLPMNIYGMTLLMYAAARNQLEIVKLLVQKGAPLNTRDRFFRTALSYAKEEKHLEIILFLLGQDAEIRDYEISQLFENVIITNNLEFVNRLFSLKKDISLEVLQSLLNIAIAYKKINIAELVLLQMISLLFQSLKSTTMNDNLVPLLTLLNTSASTLSLDQTRHISEAITAIEALIQKIIIPRNNNKQFNQIAAEKAINYYYSVLLNLNTNEKCFIAGMIILALLSGLAAGFALGLTVSVAGDLSVSQIPIIFENFFKTGSLATAGVGIIASTVTSMCVSGTASAVTAGYLTRYGIFKHDPLKSAAYDAVNSVEKMVTISSRSVTCF